jgi:hypothetical protein
MATLTQTLTLTPTRVARRSTSCVGSLGHYVLARRQDSAPRGESNCPAPGVVPHHKWMETYIGFDASECPKNMVGAGQLPLLVSPTIANIMLYHVLINSGASLNLLSLAAFKKLQVLMSKLAPLCPFSGVGPVSVMSRGSTSLLVTFGMPENYRTESVLLVVEVNLPFNAILGRPA